jgi:hypothetical protein
MRRQCMIRSCPAEFPDEAHLITERLCAMHRLAWLRSEEFFRWRFDGKSHWDDFVRRVDAEYRNDQRADHGTDQEKQSRLPRGEGLEGVPK